MLVVTSFLNDQPESLVPSLSGMIVAAVFGIAIGQIQCLRPLFPGVPSLSPIFLVKLFSILVILILSKCGSLSLLSYWLLSLILLVLLIGLVQQAGLMKDNKMPRW